MSGYWQTMVRGVFQDHADEHRPQSRDEMRCAAVELRQRGLTDLDIGQALGLAVEQVAELLEVAPE